MKPTTGLAMIAQERQEQLEIQMYAPVNDDGYLNNQLLRVSTAIVTGDSGDFPTDWDYEWYRKTIRKPINERLAIAGALIAAEIDRLNKIKP